MKKREDTMKLAIIIFPQLNNRVGTKIGLLSITIRKGERKRHRQRLRKIWRVKLKEKTIDWL